MRVNEIIDRYLVGLVTLGCDKNTVDNEYLAGLLEDAGCEVVALNDPEAAERIDAAVVLTCGFICDAQEQSVAALLELAEGKRARGKPARLFVAGCLAQRYAEDLLKEIPEIDGIVGVGQFELLAEMVAGHYAGRCNAVNPAPCVDIKRFMRRRRLDNKPYAFLKIADGCNHACSFCAIPSMKGRLRSVAPDILLKEAKNLLQQGVRELNLVAQDISVYGTDLGGNYGLPALLRALCAIEGDFWIRCLYCYPGAINRTLPGGAADALIEVMAAETKIVPYLDIPLQHLDRDLLERMNRPSANLDTAALVDRLRRSIPDLTLRTTMLVGFPGETPAAHRRMLEGMRALRFERLGAFEYSREEGTPAAEAPRQVGKATREKRRHAVMALQAEITAENNAARIGGIERVLIEDYDANRRQWIARSAADAPEVDGCVYLANRGALRPGKFVMAEITGAGVYDVTAKFSCS